MMPGELGQGGFLRIRPLLVSVSPEQGSHSGMSLRQRFPLSICPGLPPAGTFGFWVFLWLGIGVTGWWGWSVSHGGSVCGHDLASSLLLPSRAPHLL